MSGRSKTLLFFLSAALASSSAKAVILFGLDNSANQTDPGTGVAFDSVALVANPGMTSPRGSAVYLGGGYMLTANHVTVENYVTFDGSTFIQRDLSFSPVQVAANVDLKVFRLTTEPTVAAVNLYGGVSEQIAPATLVGWGRGRDATVPVNSAAVAWGSNATIAKRWGLNVPRGLVGVPYQSGGYTGFFTVLGSDAGSPAGLGANEAAATTYDSGSGLFQYLDGMWQLIGLTTGVDTLHTSDFANDQVADPSGDWNYFVRISDYRANIIALVPEPACVLLLGAGFSMIGWRRRVRRD